MDIIGRTGNECRAASKSEKISEWRLVLLLSAVVGGPGIARVEKPPK